MKVIRRFLKAVLLLSLACQLNAGVYAADTAGGEALPSFRVDAPLRASPAEFKAFSLSPVFEITAEQLQAQEAVIPVPQYAAQSRAQSTTLPQYAFSVEYDLSNLIVSAIEGSRKSIEVAIYGLSLSNVTQALLNAKKRGLSVRMVVNARHMYPRRSEQIQFLLDNGIEMRTLKGFSSYGIMHSKFGIFDSALVGTGSFNWTHTANTRNYENANFIRYPKMVNGYQQYWDWMWSYSQPVDDVSFLAQAQPVPPGDPNPSVRFNGTTFPLYSFSPRGGTKNWIMKAIAFSRKSIRVAVFSFFAKDMADALLEAKGRGVDVRILVDRSQGKSSPLTEYIINNGLDLRWSPGPSGKGMMHHKFAVFDGKLLENGSQNWSSNGEYNNFENVFYTTNTGYVKAYINEFERIYTSAHIPTSEEISSSGIFFKTGGTSSFPDGVFDFTDDPTYDLEYSE